jgi:peroxiredoxin
MRRIATILMTAALLSSAAMTLEAQGLSGRRAPSFSLPDPSMKQHDILDYRGKWLLLDFMSTTCPHCRALTKALEEFKAKHVGTVAVLSIVLPPENMNTVNRYIAENKMTTPILFDSSQVAQSYFMATPQHPSFDTPHLFAVNPQGQIVRDWSQGAVELPGFAAELEQTVAGASSTKKK